jgi:hypothetical protein
MRPILVLSTLLALAACAPQGPGTPGAAPPAGPALPDPGADSCGAAARAALIGQPATALERVYILGPVRVIRPGDAVTMDFVERRINFDLDAADRIVRIFCG